MKFDYANCAETMKDRQLPNEKAERAWTIAKPKGAFGAAGKAEPQIEARSKVARP